MIVWLFSALSVCLFAAIACGCTQTPGLCPQSLGSLCSPHGCSCASCSPVACAQRGKEGTFYVPLSCSNSECRAEVKGTCAGLLRELQLPASDCEWCSHHRQCTPLRAHRPLCCGPLRHSDGRQPQQQDCFASSFMDPAC